MNTETLEVPTVAGAPFGGGIYAGRFFVGDAAAYALIVAPKEGGELAATKWGGLKSVTGAESYCDGLTNTKAMAKAGSALGKWALGLGIADFDDWYLPSRLELLMAFGELRDQFESEWYWSSSQYTGDAQAAWCQYFFNGNQNDGHKGTELRARAVRRVPI